MDAVVVGERRFEVRRAVEEDVPALVALLTDDPLGAGRESGEMGPYLRAFREIDDDPRHLLIAVRDGAGDVVGTMQLTLLPGLSRAGATRLQIEAVRVAADARGGGLGQALLDWAHDYGRARGASLAQLTTDRTRTDAHRFYERAGYAASHVGFKRPL
ncbi:GNAT superfamily N-acetyltransferase [Nocardioides cavernae]|uniref:GNAT superfamily N-acetyltransferase n=1 Tax=Nocardioides cavernae TaxID=1921566 RepID=A0A7Y9H6Q7_9ACTN|nr:GNAT family N-acetyltransferase [Nocardioides cavernae]NYE38931.1 GNAT superfamily N-acetyltransferase [Nocardioides cavernae]